MNFKRTIDAANRWRENYNPLRGLSMSRAVTLMEDGQRGVMADLQWLYGSELGIEATDADLMTIIEKTSAGIADMDWQVVVADEKTRGFDRSLAEEQRSFLQGSYEQCDNLFDAIQHMVLARFRGFAHLQPWLKGDWTIEHLEPLPQWNMVRDGTSSRWAWNPGALQKPYRAMDPANLLDPESYVVIDNRRPVNRIALIKYIRATTNEKDWDAFCDIYGIPGVFVIMPPNIPSGKEQEIADQAEAAAEAASGALPNGSDVKTLSEVRGMQPFQMRLEWLQKQLVLAGTGGMLTTLSEPTGIGGGASGVQDSAWQTIVRRMAHTIEQPMNRQYDRRALAAMFPGRPALAEFKLRARQEKDVSDAVDSITKLSSAGYLVDPKQVTEETGYQVTLKPEPAVPQMPQGSFRGRGDAAAPEKDAPTAAQKILNEIAATILDGSKPFEEALKEAQKKLEEVDVGVLAGDLEKELEKAMFEAAAKATSK